MDAAAQAASGGARRYDPVTRENAAVIFIDLQVGPVSTIGSIEQPTLKGNVVCLARAAKLLGLPVVLTAGGQPGPAGDCLPELVAEFPDVPIVRRWTFNSCDTPGFLDAVRAAGRTKLILAGVATDVGVLLTAMSLATAGYDVYVAIDACGALTSLVEQAAYSRMVGAGVTLTSWASVSLEIQQDASREPGRALLGLVNPRLREHAGGN